MLGYDSEDEEAKPSTSSNQFLTSLVSREYGICDTTWVISLIEGRGRCSVEHALLLFEGTGIPIPEQPDLEFPIKLEFGPQDPKCTDPLSCTNFIFRRGKPVKLQHVTSVQDLTIKNNITWHVPKTEVLELFNQLKNPNGDGLRTPIYNVSGDSSNSTFETENGIHNCISYAVWVLKQVPTIRDRLKYDEASWINIKTWFRLPSKVIDRMKRDFGFVDSIV